MLKTLTKLGVPIGIVLIVVMLVVPLPSTVLDVLIACNVSGALLILLVSMFVSRPLDFASFPSVILVMTLFRLALNVSAGGGATVNTVVLLTPDEIDAAVGKKVKYTPPGG